MKPFELAPPAKDMEVRLKHNEFRDLVNELRDTADRYGGTDQLRDQLAVLAEEAKELQGRLEAAENERDALSRMLAESQANDRCAMGYLAEVRAVVGGDDFLDMVQKVKRMAGAQPAPSVPECPFPCGWRNLLTLAIEDGAYLARSINEDEPVTENARAVTMRMVLRLRDVLMALNNAAPESKTCP